MTKMSTCEMWPMRTGRRAFELQPIGDEDDLPGVGDDRLADAHLAVVEVEQRALLVDRRGADHGVIDLELADEIDRRAADDAAVGAPHRAAGDDHLDPRVAVEDGRDVDVVGDDQQPLVVEERAGDLLGRRADIDEQRGVVGDERAAAAPIARFSSWAMMRRAS